MIFHKLRCCAAILILGALGSSWCEAALDSNEFDNSIKPQDDFFGYVNGKWMKQNPIPPDRSNWGVDVEIFDRNLSRLRLLCEAAAARGPLGTLIEREVGDFYSSAIDQGGIDAAGVTPLRAEFDRIAAVKTPADVLVALGHLKSLGIPAGFRFVSLPDKKNSSIDQALLGQGGLGLPDRDYYFRDDDKSRLQRSEYVGHVAKMFILLGDEPEAAQIEATAVMRLETDLAHACLTRAVLRNPYASYHLMSLKDATTRFTPDVDWASYLRETGAPAFTEVNFAHPQFFQAFNRLLFETPIADWRSYLRWNLVHFCAPYLSQPFEKEDFDFYGAKLNGIQVIEPRWKRAIDATDSNLGEALGQLFVAAYFPPEAKDRVLSLVGNLRSAFRSRLQKSEWMDEPTRTKALEKLDSLTVKMGYPDRWRDYSSAAIARGPYILNILHLTAFEAHRDLGKIGGPADKTEWHMTAPTVSAYYNASNNEIVFPAGILEPPFFDPKADDALNYGSIGAVIGHEMTHGFDDKGRQYDAHGNLSDWWSAQSADRFKAHAAGIVKQFSEYTVLDGLNVNGQLTEGENIADLGGLLIAYDALEQRLSGNPHPLIDGYTPEQRFFLSYAISWRDELRPEALRLQVQTDPHSPANFRVNGPLSNVAEFAIAFGVSETSPMRRAVAKRLVIW